MDTNESFSDWESFKKDVSWFGRQKQCRPVGTRGYGSVSSFVRSTFPELTCLLEQADVTEVSVEDELFELLAWDSVDGRRCGWMCRPGATVPPSEVFDDHRELLACFGGIVERFNEREESWLLNHNDALTTSEVTNRSVIAGIELVFAQRELEVPVRLLDYYAVATEANGNQTLCHREIGGVILFAPEHCFEHVRVLGGCPEYTLYEIDGGKTFRDWVRTIASQWLDRIVGGR